MLQIDQMVLLFQILSGVFTNSLCQLIPLAVARVAEELLLLEHAAAGVVKTNE